MGQAGRPNGKLVTLDQDSPLGLEDLSLFDGRLPSEDVTAAVIAHPRFAAAARIVAEGLVALYQGDRTVNLVMPDRVRYIIGVFALHLHFAGRPNDPNSGLTASRLCRLCVEREVCSAGRAESMLAIMREFGYVAPAPSEEDRRLRRLVPTEALLAWHRKRCTHFFQAAALVMPEHAQALAALALPDFMPRFLRHLARTHVAGFHYVAHVPEIRLFYERNAGGALLMRIVSSGPRGEAFPPPRVSISLSSIIRDLDVSRAHARRFVQDGVNAGLFGRAGSGTDELTISGRLADAIRRATATYIVHYTHCARLARAELRRESARLIAG